MKILSRRLPARATGRGGDLRWLTLTLGRPTPSLRGQPRETPAARREEGAEGGPAPLEETSPAS